MDYMTLTVQKLSTQLHTWIRDHWRSTSRFRHMTGYHGNVNFPATSFSWIRWSISTPKSVLGMSVKFPAKHRSTVTSGDIFLFQWISKHLAVGKMKNERWDVIKEERKYQIKVRTELIQQAHLLYTLYILEI